MIYRIKKIQANCFFATPDKYAPLVSSKIEQGRQTHTNIHGRVYCSLRLENVNWTRMNADEHG